MKKKIISIILNIILFLGFYFFSDICSLVFELLNIELGNLSRSLVILIIVLMELIPLLVLVIVYRKDLKDEFKPFKENFIDNMDKYIRYWILALILMTVSNVIIELITGSNVSNNEQAIRNIMDVLPIYMIFSSCICAPIAEELAYRKAINKIFINKNLSIIASGIVFGLAHVLGTYSGISDLLYIIPYGVFGSIFMYIYLDSKSIWNTITIHFVHNSLLVIAYLIRL